MKSGIHTLLNHWHEMEIRYCHFKSNMHVEAGIDGETDLDILVDRRQYADTTSLLVQSGFKRFLPKLPSSYPAVEDWIGFDENHGKLFHLHLHWEMTAGEPNLKGYRIPWENEILSSRQFNEQYQIYVSMPEIELLLLLVRASLKHRSRDTLLSFFGKAYPDANGDIQKEFTWLQARIDHIKLEKLSKSLLPEQASTHIAALSINAAIDPNHFQLLAKLIKKHFAAYRSYSFICRYLSRWTRELYAKISQKLNKKCGLHIIRRRVPTTGGLMIAFIGVDGSGKSTQVKEMVQWLGWKVDVCRIYFGSGDGPVSLPRKPLVYLQGLRTNKEPQRASGSQHKKEPVKRGLAGMLFHFSWATTLAFEKKQRIRQAVRLRNRGMIVICDRYPQQQVMGFNDGPLLGEWRSSGGISGLLARYEASVFDMIDCIAPDMIFKLNLDADSSATRKPDTHPDMIQKKIDAVAALDFPKSMVVEIDTRQSLLATGLAIKQHIWNAL
jgi:hypothetical protein